MRRLREASGGSFRLVAMLGAVATFALAGAAFAIAAPGGNGNNPGGLNNGGHSTSGGNSSCVTDTNCSHNPTEATKPCTTGTQGNGCHSLPDTPCDRGHGGVQDKNKHCGPGGLSTSTTSPTTTSTTGGSGHVGETSTKGATAKDEGSAGESAEGGGTESASEGSGSMSAGEATSESDEETATPASSQAVTQSATFTG